MAPDAPITLEDALTAYRFVYPAQRNLALRTRKEYQLPHRAAEVVPDQHDRAAGLLVRGVQEPGVIRLGEPLALI